MFNYTSKNYPLELANFLSFLKVDRVNKFTKMAFNQTYKKTSPEVFKDLSQTLIKELNIHNNKTDLKTWEGFRLLAIDASFINLPQTEKLMSYFGNKKSYKDRGRGIIKAKCSVLYDLENKYAVIAELEPVTKSGFAIALSLLEHCKQGDLILCERSYPSYDFINHHVMNNLDFVIRTKLSFRKIILDFKKSKKDSQIVTMNSDRHQKLSGTAADITKPIKVRLIRRETSDGKVEILMTSLLDFKKYPNQVFQSLYTKRWSAESFYEELNNKWKIDCFSGYNRQSILQDFYAALFISNIQTRIVSELGDEIEEKNNQIKSDYKTDSNLSYDLLKNGVIELFSHQKSSQKPFNELKQLFIETMVPTKKKFTYKRDLDNYKSRTNYNLANNL
jgi:hypothetical protein